MHIAPSFRCYVSGEMYKYSEHLRAKLIKACLLCINLYVRKVSVKILNIISSFPIFCIFFMYFNMKLKIPVCIFILRTISISY